MNEIERLRVALEKARAIMEDALSVGEATYEDFDIKLNPWADLSLGVEEILREKYGGYFAAKTKEGILSGAARYDAYWEEVEEGDGNDA